MRLTCLLKLKVESIVAPSSLKLLDKGIGEPAISTWLMLPSDLFRAWVPRRMASDFFRIQGKTVVVKPGSEVQQGGLEAVDLVSSVGI